MTTYCIHSTIAIFLSVAEAAPVRALAPLAAPPPARLVAPAPAPCGAAARQKQARVRQPAA